MGITIGVVGATGLVGEEIIKRIGERNIQFENIRFFASKKSEGKKILLKGKEYFIEELREDNIKGIDYLLFAAGGDISRKYARKAVEKGTIVIDNSSEFRMDKDVPLIIPEINGDEIKKHKGIIANPNCSTIQAVMSISPIYERYGIERIVYSSYQSVSGSGKGGILDLERTINGEKEEFYPIPIGYNLIPHIDDFLDNGYTKEEMKMINETNKILNDNIKITATTVRVPVKYSHSISINLETKENFSMTDVLNLFKNAKGIILKDDIKNNIYPTPIDAEGRDEIFVGRIRRDYSLENGINLWSVGDNIRKGASTNAVQILELLLKGGK